MELKRNGRTKRIHTAVLALMLAVTVLFAGFPAGGSSVSAAGELTAEGFSGGTGTADDPWLISTAEQLALVNNHLSGNFRLTGDIDLTVYLGEDGAGSNEGKGWEPLGNGTNAFIGSLDGGGYTVSGLWIDRQDEDYIGLFGNVGNTGVIQNINVTSTGAGLHGNSFVGGLVGNLSGTIEGSSADCDVTAYAEYGYAGGLVGISYGAVSDSRAAGSVTTNKNFSAAGGLVGYQNGSITNSYATGNVTAERIDGSVYAGGLVGYQYGSITNSYAAGNVTAESTSGNVYAGGLSGYHYDNYTTGSYALGSVTASTETGTVYAGAFAGHLFNDYLTGITSGYYNSDVNSELSPIGYASGTNYTLTGQTETSLKKQATYEATQPEGWDFTGDDTPPVWIILEDMTYPMLYWQIADSGTGTENDPYIITIALQLDSIRVFIDNGMSTDVYWKLGNDIDIESYSYKWDEYNTDPDDDIEDGELVASPGWEPLGNGTNAFIGSLDGGGYMVSGLWIDRQDEDYIGLFGNVGNTGVIKNINVTSTGASLHGNSFVGGLVGNLSGTIEGSSADCDVTAYAEYGYAGGLVGISYGAVSDSRATGSVTTNKNLSAAGGLVGYQNSGSITNSYASGDVTAESTGGIVYAGGLVGQQRGSITNSYATGNVTAESTSGSVNAGGLVGHHYDNYTTGSYALGSVTASTETGTVYAGAFDGYLYNDNQTGTISGYYNSGVNSGLEPVGYVYEDGGSYDGSTVRGLTEEELRSRTTYADEAEGSGWDFDTVWGMYTAADGDTGYGLPYLKTMANHILVTPDGGTKTYDGTEVTAAPAWTADSNYDEENTPLTGELGYGTATVKNAGAYGIEQGTLDGTGYQLRFRDDVQYIITKAAPEYTAPSVNAVYGQTLGELTLPEGFEWEAADSTASGSIGPNTHKVKYTPDDTVNYTIVTGIDVIVTVAQAGTTTSLTAAPSSSEYGETVKLTAEITVTSPGTGTVTGTVEFFDGLVSLGTATVTEGKAELEISTLAGGTHKLTAVYSGDTSFSGSTTAELDYDVEKAGQETFTIQGGDIRKSLGDGIFTVEATGGSGTGTVSWSSSNEAVALVDENGAVTIMGAGTAVITAAKAGDGNYNEETASVTLTVVDRSLLRDRITEAEELLDNADIGEEAGQYPEEAAGKLEKAIEDAQTVLDNDKASQAEIDEAEKTLETAAAEFLAAEIPGTVPGTGDGGQLTVIYVLLILSSLTLLVMAGRKKRSA